MAKIKNSVWGVFTQGLHLYFTNFGSFMKYMAFPVFGQLIGILVTLLTAFLYAANLPNFITKGGIFDNFSMIFLVLLIIIIPGLFIFAKAFWDYLVAYGAINSMVENMLKSGKVYDFPAHTELITRRTAGFIGVWIIYSILLFIGLCPLFWIIIGILFVYFVLVFQVFTFEPDKSPVECFQKSFMIIKGNFARTLGLLALLTVLTYWALPAFFNFLLTLGNIITFFAIPFDIGVQQLPIAQINNLLLQTPTAYQITSLMIAKWLVEASLSSIIIFLTLPIRSICWALWYKNLNKAEVKLDKRILDRAQKSE